MKIKYLMNKYLNTLQMENKNKVGGAIVLVGGTGTGKTPTIKNFISEYTPKNTVIYDPRNEYSDEFTRFRKFKYFREFTKELCHSFIIVEEATSVLSSFKDLEISEWMIASEHNNCILFFAYHSLMDASPYVLRLAKFVILFDTADDPKDIKTSRHKYFDYLPMKKPVFIHNTL